MLAWAAAAVLAAVAAAGPIVNTTDGAVLGAPTQWGSVKSFKGVPFAQPPVGSLRFRAPLPGRPWEGVRNATDFGPGCVSHCNGHIKSAMCTKTVSEDCLYLNVYTPSTDRGAKLPVIFFIHGGDFLWGSGGVPLYDGSRWAHDENVVVVTINYRLNIFGALTTSELKGNYGVLDQRVALQWVHANAAAFGGDNTRVTVSGQSAGAMSVGYHLASPKSWPYFQRAAVISNPYGLPPPSKKMAQDLGLEIALQLKCPTSGPEQRACLEKVSPHALLEVSKRAGFLPSPSEVLADFAIWCPHVDGDVIPEPPLKAMVNGRSAPVPLYIGTVANESIPFIFGAFNKPMTAMAAYEVLTYFFGIEKAERIVARYGPADPNTPDTRAYLSRIMTDFLFYCSSHRAARGHSLSHGNESYVYLFDEHPSWALQYFDGHADNPCVKYICHAFDLPTIFNTVYVLGSAFPQPTAREEALSHYVQHAWATFTATGRPAQPWPQFTTGSRLVMNLSIPLPTKVVDGYLEGRCDLWDSIGYDHW